MIVRDNMPFGSVGAGEFGTYYIGYSATPDVTELKLGRMFIGEPPGNHDRILGFSTAVTGCLFFVPTANFLDNQPNPGSGAVNPVPTSQEDTPPDTRADGSLSIGSLKRSGTS